MKYNVEFYRNLPFIDCKFPFIFFQKMKMHSFNSYYIELPFVGLKIKHFK